MNLQEIEKAVATLGPGELAVFSRWFEEYVASCWDQQIEADVKAGKLDGVMRQADEDFDAGRCTPL